tara:strand:- start:861 stop:2162 length:1302 start_codon:yes stop_codon:yes gene_type:complete
MAQIAAAFGTFMRAEGEGAPIYVGRDSRVSGPMFSRAVISGLQSVGAKVVDLGMVPTPTLMLAVEQAEASGGIVITASHNPADWNALKLVTGEGVFLAKEQSERFYDFLSKEDLERVSWDLIEPVIEDREAWQRHLHGILALPEVDVGAIRRRGIRVALDCVNGAGGPVMAELLSEFGCIVEAIGMSPDGRFPRDPEPTAANLTELCKLVRDTGSEVGFAIDPDVDRLSLVDETGRAMGEDLTLAFAASVILMRNPGPVVTNLSTSQVLDDVADAFSVPLTRAPVGEINVARQMMIEGAVVGGEGNGGVILPALHHTRDAPLAAALILQALVDASGPPSVAAARWPSYSIVKEKIGFPREALPQAYEILESDLDDATVDHTDGLRLTWRDRSTWLHLRPSGTEPVVRLIVEAPDEGRAKVLLDRVSGLLEGVV